MTHAAEELPDGPRWAPLHALGRAADRAHACFVAGIGVTLGFALAFLLVRAAGEETQWFVLGACVLAALLTGCVRLLELHLAASYRVLHRRLEGVPEPAEERAGSRGC